MKAVLLFIGGLLASSLTATAQPKDACVISGGTNYGTITQNCLFNTIPPPIQLMMKDFAVQETSDHNFTHRILVRIVAVADLILVGCGDDIMEVAASPWPAGLTVPEDLGKKANCLGFKYNNATPGKWMIQVTTKAKASKFTLTPFLQ